MSDTSWENWEKDRPHRFEEDVVHEWQRDMPHEWDDNIRRPQNWDEDAQSQFVGAPTPTFLPYGELAVDFIEGEELPARTEWYGPPR